MAVVIETTLGDITVDLYLEQRPVTCLNFLKLCKMKYYNFNLFHTIRSGFIAQTGDPTGEGSGGESIFGLLEGPGKRFFSGEKMPKIRHTNAGLLSMVGTDDVMVGSQFFFTLGSDLDSLDNIHCVIGEVTEGHEVLRKLNEAICDETHRPYQDVRITHTVVLEDPFNDPPGFHAPSRSPSPSAERLKGGRIAPDEDIDETQGKSAEEIQEIIEEKEAKARATILEIVGDLPDADIAPPENVLFVCKLNPVTTDEDLEIIFSRFGEIVNCEVIRDKKTGDSLQYAFIEFSNKKSCEDAYFKMDNVLIDDRRIHVDFSQSVSKMRYLGKGRLQHFNDDEVKDNHSKQRYKRSGSEEHVRNQLNNKHTDREKHTHKRYDDERKVERDERKRERDTEYRRRRDQDTGKERRKELENRKAERDFERRKEKHDHEERREKERDYEKRKRMDIESKQNSRRERSRSRSQEQSRSIREDSRETKHRNNDKNNYRNDNGSSKYDEEVNKRNKPGQDDSMQRERHSNSHKSKYKSPPRDRDSSSNRNEKVDKSSRKNHDNVDKNPKENQIDDSKDISRHESKKRHAEDEESHSKNKRLKKKKPESVAPRTPSPVKSKNKTHKTKAKINEKNKKNSKKDKSAKKKRKVSTSTDSDSSESSTSSDSSSSSEDDRKKRSKKKRKHSTSSSSDSSDSSSSSSSSSDSSSDSSSSSSGSEKNRKRKRNDTKKKVKQSKKKA